MPSRDEHLVKAEGNEQFAASLTHENQTKIDWALVVMFYSAVHYIEAYLAVQFGIHVRSHNTRDNSVARDSNLRTIYSSYQHLKYYGYNARYEVFGFSARDIQDATKDLADVKAKVVPHL